MPSLAVSGTPHLLLREGKVAVVTVGVASSLAATGGYEYQAGADALFGSSLVSRPGFVINSGSYPAAEQSRTLALTPPTHHLKLSVRRHIERPPWTMKSR